MPQQHPGASGDVSPPPHSRFIGVDLHQVRLCLDGRTVLQRIDWSIRPAQRWLLTGHNGAGKTLLLKLVAGDVWPTPHHESRAQPGRRLYLYRGRRFEQPHDVRHEIAYLGAERQDRYERHGWNHRVEEVIGTGLYRTDIPLDPLSVADRERIARLLLRLHMLPLAPRRFLTLSYGERRLVLLARALAAAPKLLLLDELFNGLDAVNRAQATHCLELLSRSGLPWVLSSHRDEEVPARVTHRCELAGGIIRAQGPVGRARAGLPTVGAPRAPSSARISPLTRRGDRLAATDARSSTGASSGSARAEAAVLIRVRHATVWRAEAAVLRGLSLELRAGQCWVLHGANGSGKSSCIQLLYGDLSPGRAGRIERTGIGKGVPIAQFKRRVGLVAPELQAMHPRDVRVEEVVASGLTASISHGGTRAPRSARVQRALRKAGIAALAGRALRTLSYGQLRRVLFARALVGEPDILLLDEPYAGLDATTRLRLRALVERAAQSGVTVLMATHHEDDRPSATTHELELSQGRTVYQGPLRAQEASTARRPGRRRA